MLYILRRRSKKARGKVPGKEEKEEEEEDLSPE